MADPGPAGRDDTPPGATQPTIGRLLGEATVSLRQSGSESARLDAELLLGHVLGMGRAGVLAHPEIALSPGQAAAFESAVRRRAAGEPVAYIRGLKEFYGLAFAVDRRALIPRPETELLVGLAVERLREMLTGRPRPAGAPTLQVWDVGTGSGAIAVSIAVECRRRGYAADLRLLATDVSPEALGLAVENAVAHGVADILDFAAGDLLDVDGPADRPATDLLVANLPYVPSAVVPELPVAASFEPALALDGGPDGLASIRRLLDGLPAVLAAGGQALLEIGAGQEAALVDDAATRLPGWSVRLHADLAGLPRVAELSR